MFFTIVLILLKVFSTSQLNLTYNCKVNELCPGGGCSGIKLLAGAVFLHKTRAGIIPETTRDTGEKIWYQQSEMLLFMTMISV